MKTDRGFGPGYNAQAMVSPVDPDSGMTGMLVTAADVVDEPNDYYRLAPMVLQAEETTGTKAPMTLADAGYFTGSHLEECARRGQRVVVPDPQQKLLQQLARTFSPTTRATTAITALRDRQLPNKPKGGMTIRMYRASGSVCRECPAFGVCTRDGTHGRG